MSDANIFDGVRGMFRELRTAGFLPKRILDIGANCGQFAAICHCTFPEAHVTSIEPNVACRPMLLRAADEMHFSLLSDSERDVTFWTNADNPVSLGNSYYQETLSQFPHTVPVQMRTTTLEKLLAGKEPYELVKLDTQGSELDILRGGREIVRKAEYVLCEMQCDNPSNAGAPTRAEVEAELLELGFGDGMLLEWWFQKNNPDDWINADWIYRRVR